MKYQEIYDEYSDLLSKKDNERELRKFEKKLINLEKAAELTDKNIHRHVINLKNCFLMDSLAIDERKRALEFSSAMCAIEGVPASDETEANLALWAEGKGSWSENYLRTLKKYSLIE